MGVEEKLGLSNVKFLKSRYSRAFGALQLTKKKASKLLIKIVGRGVRRI